MIKANEDRFESISKVETIIVIGHSLSAVDYPYFKEIINNNKNIKETKWYISWHGVGSLKQIDIFANAMGIHANQIELFRV